MSEELKKSRTVAENFCKSNLKDCASEIVEWQNTGVLRDGKVRELANLCRAYVGNAHGLQAAETMVANIAMADFASRPTVSPQSPDVDDARWVKEPIEQADYWHWDGDEDHAPMIYHVLWSGTAKKCFVSIGQYGIDEAIWCDNFGGWWLKIDQPALPKGEINE